MMYNNFIKDFAVRTQFNVDFIERNATNNGPYEITNMINSLLGTLVFIKERHLFLLRDIDIDMDNDNLLIIKDINNDTSFINIVFHMRNAVSHHNIGPVYNHDEISHFIFLDKNYRIDPRTPTWIAKISCPKIKEISIKIVNTIRECELFNR